MGDGRDDGGMVGNGAAGEERKQKKKKKRKNGKKKPAWNAEAMGGKQAPPQQGATTAGETHDPNLRHYISCC
jgi:hypothetical protein